MPGFLLITLAAITWGTTGATLVLVARDSAMSPLLVGFVRVAVAAPCLVLAAHTIGGGLSLPPARDRRPLLAAGMAMGSYQVCYFWGVAKTSVAIGSLVAICSAPLFITALAGLVLGERVTPRTWAALGAGVVGAALLTAGPRGLEAPPLAFGTGVALALGAGLSYATYAILVKDTVDRVPPYTVAAITFSVAAVSLAPALLAGSLSASPSAWMLLAYLGVVPTALAYVLYVVGLRTTPVTVSGVLTLVEPLTATLLGVTFFGDRLGRPGTAGAALLIGAVLLLTRRTPPATGRGS